MEIRLKGIVNEKFVGFSQAHIEKVFFTHFFGFFFKIFLLVCNKLKWAVAFHNLGRLGILREL